MELAELEQINRSTCTGFIKYWKQRPYHFEELYKVSSDCIEELAHDLVHENLFKDMELTNHDDEYCSDLIGEL